MRLLVPTPLMPPMLTATTLPENDYPAWSAATTSALGDRVILAATHRMYESLQASNLNHNPSDPVNAAWWVDIGATNAYRAMDGGVGSKATGSAPAVLVLQPGMVDSLALVDVDADSARLQVVIEGVTAYDQTLPLSAGSLVETWWDYFFQSVVRRSQGLFRSLPQSSTATLHLTLQAGTAPNLCPDVETWTLPAGFSVIDTAPWGHRAQAGVLADGTYTAISPHITDIKPGVMYAVSGDSMLQATTGTDYFEMLFYDASNALLLNSTRPSFNAGHDYMDGQVRRDALSVSEIAPVGASYLVTRYVVESATGITAAGFRQPKVEVGSLPATAFIAYTATPTTITVGVGEVIAGKLSEIGATQYGASVGIIDYSKKETDSFGTTSVVKRTYAKRMQFQLMLPSASVDWLQSTLANLRATPAYWVAADGFDALAVYGYYKDFSIDIVYPTMSSCSLTVEGLT